MYKSIDFLPVWNFFRVIETNDTRYLFKLRDYEQFKTSHSAVSEWNAICEQYFKESIGVKYFQYKSLRLHIIDLRRKLLILTNALTVLCIVKDQAMIEVVRKYGYRFDDSTEDVYADSILNLDSQIKGLIKQIGLKEDEYKRNFATGTSAADIYQLIDNIESWKGFKVDLFTLTVRQFLQYQKSMFKESNAAKARNFSKKVSHGQR